MNRMEILQKEWEKTYMTEGWYPPLKPVLAGLTASQASWRPTGVAANTIWEHLQHLLYYNERFLERLKGGNPADLASTNDDTFTVPFTDDDEAAWQETVKRAEAVYEGLREVLSSKSDLDFEQPIANSHLGDRLLNLIIHIAYHTGQIVQIRKLQGSWPARRSFE